MDVSVEGPVPTSPQNPVFGAAHRAVVPLELDSYGYVEEEYFLAGTAFRYAPGPVADGGPYPYRTRLLVRRPREAPSGVTYASVLNASHGYDIEDDWRRAWDWIIEQRHSYVGITLKPIAVEALQMFNPPRYASLTWRTSAPQESPVVATRGWDPWQVRPGSEEGLAWDILVDLAGVVREPGLLPGGSRRVFLMGQSQSGVYVNTFLAHMHSSRRRADGGPLYDGYLPGVAATLTRSLVQGAAGPAHWTVGPAPDLDVPVILVTSDGDLDLYSVTKPTSAHGSDLLPQLSADPYAVGLGDGPLRRQYQVAGTPHSDARSPVLPTDRDIVRAGRLPRQRTQECVERLNTIPLEPVVTGAMAALLRWVDDGVPAPPSLYFEQKDGVPYADEYGITGGGLRLGMVEHPLGTYHGASAEDAKYGGAELFSSYDVASRYPDRNAYLAVCDEVDDGLEAAGYLEPVGRRLLRRVAGELWDRVVEGAPALWSTPQGPAG